MSFFTDIDSATTKQGVKDAVANYGLSDLLDPHIDIFTSASDAKTAAKDAYRNMMKSPASKFDLADPLKKTQDNKNDLDISNKRLSKNTTEETATTTSHTDLMDYTLDTSTYLKADGDICRVKLLFKDASMGAEFKFLIGTNTIFTSSVSGSHVHCNIEIMRTASNKLVVRHQVDDGSSPSNSVQEVTQSLGGNVVLKSTGKSQMQGGSAKQLFMSVHHEK